MGPRRLGALAPGLWPSLHGEQEPLCLEHPVDRTSARPNASAQELCPNLVVAVGGEG